MKHLSLYINESLSRKDLYELLDSLHDYINDNCECEPTKEDILDWLQNEDGLANWADECDISDKELGDLTHQYYKELEEMVQEIEDEVTK